MGHILAYAQNIRIIDIIDILIVAYVIYKFMIMIRATRAEQLIKGIIAFIIFAIIINFLNLYTMKWILDKTLVYGFLSIMIVFQPELRKALEFIGRSNFFSRPFAEVKEEEIDVQTEEITRAVYSMSRQEIGGIIVIERNTGLSEIIDSGTLLDADISSELLINIFIPNAPLHDGAVIIRGSKIKAAGCFLPLSGNATLSKELGTRHRAALGMTERSDAVVIVVSEESGAVSVAEEGKLTRYVDEETLKLMLRKIFQTGDKGLFSLIVREEVDEKDQE